MKGKDNRSGVTMKVRKFFLHWGGFAIIIIPLLYFPELRACILSIINGLGGVGKAILFAAAVGAGGMLINRIAGALISPFDTNGKNDCECGRLPAGPTGRVDYFGYIRRDFPSFWVEPWKWLFGGWPIWRGVLNVDTGNITITPKLILWLRKNVDPQGEWIGFYEVVSGEAARVVLAEKNRIENTIRSGITQADKDRLAFIDALLRDGVQLVPVDQEKQTAHHDQKIESFAVAAQQANVDLKDAVDALVDVAKLVTYQHASTEKKVEAISGEFKRRQSVINREAKKAAREAAKEEIGKLSVGCTCKSAQQIDGAKNAGPVTKKTSKTKK